MRRVCFTFAALALFAPLVPVALAAPPEGVVRIHYHRPDGVYAGWGLHVWEDADASVTWATPLPATGTDAWGAYWDVRLKAGAEKVGFIIHKGETKDPGADMFLDIDAHGREVWIVSGKDAIETTEPDVSALAFGDPSALRAHWLDRNTIAWRSRAPAGANVTVHDSPDAALEFAAGGVSGGGTIRLAALPRMPERLASRYPHLRSLPAYSVRDADVERIRAALRGQVVVAATNGGRLVDAAGVQLAGVLDDLYADLAGNDPFGVSWVDGRPRLRLWAPTARSVRLHRFETARGDAASVVDMSLEDGVWSVIGESDWNRDFYLYEVEVYVPSTGRIERNLVTDPYSTSLSMNSTRSQIVDLADRDLVPEGWTSLHKRRLAAPEDAVIYELHVRDFSVYDESVPDSLRGTYAAFTVESAGLWHLGVLSEAGLTHVHLLPVFDIATVNEDRTTWADPGNLERFPPDSDEQQAAIARIRGRDAYNWGYDPLHYGVPEGSYSTDPDGPRRILEFREMVKSLSEMDLRVVMDVVYNHTHASGQSQRSVLDRIVPGYYHRLNENGDVETSTCCQNTASENRMMERLIINDLVHWARDYKVDGFRFDLMGHHMKRNMVNVRRVLDRLTLERDGIDGKSLLLYGEGWDFGEVAQGRRGVNATQGNMAGTGIGTFNDRIRDAVRGGNPFGDRREQGFATGLFTAPNGFQGGGAGERGRLLEAMDRIRVGLAGNLSSYRFADRNGREITGGQLDYGGYTSDPQEAINYASAHDNETLWDKIALAVPRGAGVEERVRRQTLALSVVLLGQGIPFLHAGSEILRSKAMDSDSYDSGDWFNAIDFYYRSNRFGIGLPIADKNQERWPIMRPLLARPELTVGGEWIERAFTITDAMLSVRSSSPLFRLRTAEDVQARLHFHNTGSGQTPGLIVMSLHDDGDLADLDPGHERIFVLFNATPETHRFSVAAARGAVLELHRKLRETEDARQMAAAFDATTGTFEVPALTTVVWVENE